MPNILAEITETFKVFILPDAENYLLMFQNFQEGAIIIIEIVMFFFAYHKENRYNFQISPKINLQFQAVLFPLLFPSYHCKMFC
jgi:hypothetical protein